MLKKLNEYFICDADQQASISDYIFFYGLLGLVFIIGVFFLVGIGKGV